MSKSEHIFFWKLHVFKTIIFFLWQFNSIFRKELLKASPNVLSKSFIGVVFCNSILRKIIYLGLEKYWTALLRSLGSHNYDLIDLNSKKYLNSLTGIGLILRYTGTILEKYSDYLTGFGLILWYNGLGLTYWTPLNFSTTKSGCR